MYVFKPIMVIRQANLAISNLVDDFFLLVTLKKKCRHVKSSMCICLMDFYFSKDTFTLVWNIICLDHLFYSFFVFIPIFVKIIITPILLSLKYISNIFFNCLVTVHYVEKERAWKTFLNVKCKTY